MSDLFRNRCPATNASGFTLLEVLVVLTIIGFVAAVSVPRLGVMYDSAVFALERETFEQDLSGLPYQAYRLGSDLMLAGPALRTGAADTAVRPAELSLPEGWRLETAAPIYYRASGFCGGGALTVTAGNVSERYVLKPPFCVAEAVQ